jgi:hypothetical protein
MSQKCFFCSFRYFFLNDISCCINKRTQLKHMHPFHYNDGRLKDICISGSRNREEKHIFLVFSKPIKAHCFYSFEFCGLITFNILLIYGLLWIFSAASLLIIIFLLLFKEVIYFNEHLQPERYQNHKFGFFMANRSNKNSCMEVPFKSYYVSVLHLS